VIANELNIVKGGYALCPLCHAQLTRVTTSCPKCDGALDPRAISISRSSRGSWRAFLRSLDLPRHATRE
jgi:predicted amidophosphoribosyltransferase